MTVADLLLPARQRLAALPFASGREAHLLLGHVLARDEPWLLAHGEAAVDAADVARFRALVERRAQGEPVAYLTGAREFYGRRFAVDDRVLVPRPETEHLIEAALRVAPSLPARPRILDVGAGSGCIAVTLALEIRGSRVVTTDASPAALAVTARNARALGARVAPLAARWTEALDLGTLDLVVSNPPYLVPGDASVQTEVARWEPAGALWGGDDGLDAYRAILAGLAGVRVGTPLLLELGAGQAAALGELAHQRGWGLLGFERDLAGIERVGELRRR